MCGEQVVSLYHKDTPRVVYCLPCWWSDKWDGLDYGREYDPSRSFFEQYFELLKELPLPALETQYTTNINTHYTNFSGYQKNCYMTSFADQMENCSYVSFANNVKDAADCYRIRDSELCYESMGINKCYRTFYCEECDSCVDMYFSKNCIGCTNCFGCVNLRKQSYCIFNEQVTKEAYNQFIEQFNSGSHESVELYKEKIKDFWLKFPVRNYIGNSLNLNVFGDYIYESKNTYFGYMVTSAENSKYVALLSVPSTKESYDYTGWGDHSELVYESQSIGEGGYNVRFSAHSYPEAMNLEYCLYAVSGSNNLFGCGSLKRKSYAILNKEYSKEEYEQLRERIISDMNTNPYFDDKGRTWKYGEFPPIGFLPFAYNETIAQDFFCKTKDETMNAGFKWRDKERNAYRVTVEAAHLPDSIATVTESILGEVIACSCSRAYKIGQGELKLLQQLHLPLPHECPECRRMRRFKSVNLPIFYDRTCARCNAPIQTSYAPDRPEVIYCEKCYQQEVY
jgi:hypothetical protein